MTAEVLTRFNLDRRVVLVTGASSGLGQHLAQTLAGAGARVALTARRADKLTSTVERIRTNGGQAIALSLDVTSVSSVNSCLDALSAEWGAPDVLINNAGVTVTRSLLDQTEEDWDRVMTTNLKGAWLVATEAARRMVAVSKGGAIINVASILGIRVAGGVAPYAISKAGVVQATKVMALELARHRIRVNALLPGYVITDLNRDFLQSEAGDKLRMRIPSRRFLELSDLDGPMLLLASDAGAAMTGSCLTVDAGHLVSSL